MSKHEQSLLFLNRRGTASAILCSQCGWQALCPHCDLAMTYHGDTHLMRCHVCGRTQPLPGSCPDCSETDIILKTIGTKAVVEEVKRLFPHARVMRFDTDATKAEQLENHLATLKEGNVDIIVGTQMITKGSTCQTFRSWDTKCRQQPADTGLYRRRTYLPAAYAGNRPRWTRSPCRHGVHTNIQPGRIQPFLPLCSAISRLLCPRAVRTTHFSFPALHVSA